MKNQTYFIIATRFNPQIGSYPMDLMVGKVIRHNKGSVTVRYEQYGFKHTLCFDDAPAFAYCQSKSDCIYGDVEYRGWADKEDLVERLNNAISQHTRFQSKYEQMLKQVMELN